MPFKSEAQRGYLWANDPAVAAKFEKDTKKTLKLPKHVKQAKPEPSSGPIDPSARYSS